VTDDKPDSSIKAIMSRMSAEEYTKSLAQIFGGSWRQVLWAEEQGIPAALGLTTEQWVKDRLGGYVRLSIEERNKAIDELLSTSGHSLREIAQIIGVSKSTVHNRTAKLQRRVARERELAGKICALPERKYGVIYADPPWKFAPWSANGMDRSAANHYLEQETTEILALDVDRLAYNDSVLFLWATVPMQKVAFAVMDGWGFDYRTEFVWHKDKIGTGFWNRNKHEKLLVGVRGNPPAPAPGEQWDSIVEAPRTLHSVKPEKFYQLIEAYIPNLPKLELYARNTRPGWDSWGNEIPTTAAASSSAAASPAAAPHVPRPDAVAGTSL